MPKGGKRAGAGRPPGRRFPVRVLICLTPEQREKLRRLGGGRFVREAIERTIPMVDGLGGPERPNCPCIMRPEIPTDA